MTYYCVMKMQKVNRKRQTWGLWRLREKVSATVWERVPDTLTYYSALECRRAAHQQFDLKTFHRQAGRGSAQYVTSSK